MMNVIEFGADPWLPFKDQMERRGKYPLEAVVIRGKELKRATLNHGDDVDRLVEEYRYIGRVFDGSYPLYEPKVER